MDVAGLKTPPDCATASKNTPTLSGSSAEAVKCYSQAIAGAEHDETLFANRSASYLAQQLFDEAIKDAMKTVQLKEAWPKGHYRCQLAAPHCTHVNVLHAQSFIHPAYTQSCS